MSLKGYDDCFPANRNKGMTRPYQVGDVYRLRHPKGEDGPHAWTGHEVMIEEVHEDGEGIFTEPMSDKTWFASDWRLDFIRSSPKTKRVVVDEMPTFPEGTVEWAGLQVLMGKAVTLRDEDGGCRFGTKTFKEFLGWAWGKEGSGWKLYVEPPKPYVAEVGTDVWALAMLLEGKPVVSDSMSGPERCSNPKNFISFYAGKGSIWRLV